MSVPLSQMWAVSSFVLKQKFLRKKRYPLVLMLEPLLRCNLSCAGCGKIQYPGHILKNEMSVEQALAAVDECDTPIVSIPGGEPLLHSRIDEIVAEIIQRKKYVYLCTNALLLKEKIDLGYFRPSKYLTFSVHLDGDEEAHDFSVCRKGTYQKAEEAMRYAIEQGFRVTSNTTLFNHADVGRTRKFFDRMMELGVEGMMISPGYSYSKAPDQESFLSRHQTFELFRSLLKKPKKSWKFNQSPLFLEFLMGKRHFECTPWGNPCYTLFGWQRPCYLLQEGYAASFKELLEETNWENFGRQSGNPKCQQCMVHCGYEPTAVDATFGSWSGFWGTLKTTLFGLNSDRGKNVMVPTVGRFVQPEVDKVLQEAMDFRGDVTFHLKDGSKKSGFVFDVSEKGVTYFPINEKSPQQISRDKIAKVELSGHDWADGKSWESWVKKNHAKKAEKTAPLILQ